jgi:N-acylneuraminate cytidylyltransferase
VDEAIEMLLKHPEADSVRGVVPAGQNPHKMWRIDDQSGRMQPLLHVEGIAEPYNAPRQILPPVYWQTGHIDAIRPSAILEKHSMSGDVILPVLIDPRFTVDIDNLFDWKRYEYLVVNGNLEMVYPGQRRRPIPEDVELIVFDFDGVMTDNRVWVGEDGYEQVAAYRSDGTGLHILRRKTPIKCLVLSSEYNPVVEVRCKKLQIPVISGALDKPPFLKKYLEENHIDPQKVVYLGNDVNDIPCFPLVGCAVVVADAEPLALQQADVVLSRRGGHGAVRELCDIFLQRSEERSSNA